MKTKHVIAKTGEIADGSMKQVQVGDQELLICRIGDSYYAYPAECPHHGAPLAEGVLHEGHIRCPWHQAMFDARSGKLQEPPSLDSLTPLEVQVVGDNVAVLLPKDYAASQEPEMAEEDRQADLRRLDEQGEYLATGPANETLRQGRTFVIVGAGAAGEAAAEALRQEGFRGNITLVTAESHLPYDRTELSKRNLAKPESDKPTLRGGRFFDRHDIDILYETTVESLDPRNQEIHFAHGASLRYDAVLLATGARPRRLDAAGVDLQNVFALRSLDDHEAISHCASDVKRAVVVGASFIGMEVAASLTQRGLEVEVVEVGALPFARSLGRRVGRLVQAAHEKAGTQFHFGQKVQAFEGQDKVQAVVLEDGRRIEADMVVMGVGVDPVTDYLPSEWLTEDGGVKVDATLQCAPQCFAAGDIVRVPDWRGDGLMRIEHWRYAQQTGRLAGRNMLGRDESYAGVPFFWTKQHDLILQYVGYCDQWDEVRVEGNIEDKDFVAYLLRDGEAMAAVGCFRDAQMGRIAEAMRASRAMAPEKLGLETKAKL